MQAAVHHGIGVRTDPGSADGVPEARRGGPREIEHVLLAGGVRARDDLGFANVVECLLTTELAGRDDRSKDGGQILVRAEVVALDDGRVAPIGCQEPNLAAAGRLDERRGNGETFLRWRAESRRRVRCRSSELLQHQLDVPWMTGMTAREDDLCVGGVT